MLFCGFSIRKHICVPWKPYRSKLKKLRETQKTSTFAGFQSQLSVPRILKSAVEIQASDETAGCVQFLGVRQHGAITCHNPFLSKGFETAITRRKLPSEAVIPPNPSCGAALQLSEALDGVRAVRDDTGWHSEQGIRCNHSFNFTMHSREIAFWCGCLSQVFIVSDFTSWFLGFVVFQAPSSSMLHRSSYHLEGTW